MTNPRLIDPKRYIDNGDGTFTDLEMPEKTARIQEDFAAGAGPKKTYTPIEKAVAAEKEELNEAQGVIHGQIK